MPPATPDVAFIAQAGGRVILEDLVEDTHGSIQVRVAISKHQPRSDLIYALGIAEALRDPILVAEFVYDEVPA